MVPEVFSKTFCGHSRSMLERAASLRREGLFMKILLISGALRKGSTNTALLRAVMKLAPADMEMELVTLHGIPPYDGDDEDANGKPPAVAQLQDRIRAADGIIISTPEYNFSVPGVLKNAT